MKVRDKGVSVVSSSFSQQLYRSAITDNHVQIQYAYLWGLTKAFTLCIFPQFVTLPQSVMYFTAIYLIDQHKVGHTLQVGC